MKRQDLRPKGGIENSIFVFGILSLVLLILVFSLGFLLAVKVEADFGIYELEETSNIGNSLGNVAPSDFIKESDIEIYEDRVVIYVEGASLSSYTDTGSMRPTVDRGTNGLRIVPRSEEDIFVGDLVTFEKDGVLIMHRVVDKGVDEKGIYFETKGDNNEKTDGRIYFDEIKFKTFANVY